MGQSLASVYVHAVFSTKERRPLIKDPTVRKQLHAYLGGICNAKGSTCITVGGTEDHVHILYRQSRTESISDTIRSIKSGSSSWIKGHDRMLEFSWQSGYGAFSVGFRELDAIIAYIGNQEEHHRKVSFMDELRGMLEEHGIEYDEKYLWTDSD